MPYDPVRDLAPIGTLLTGSMIIAAHPDFEGTSLSALIDIARKRPGEIQFAVPGNGSPPHIVLATLMNMTGTRFSVVPFKRGT
jgi:tripartite-type tricarboxylate transporter receptor subunit TctC